MYTALLFALSGKAEFYGYFAFFLLLQAFACGFFNSLVNTPHFDASKSKVKSYKKICDDSFFVFSIILSALSSIVISLSMFSLGASLPETILAGAAVFCYCIRWFLRSAFNTANKNNLCYRSDFLFSLSYISLLTLISLLDEVSIFNVMLVSFVSSFVSVVYSIYCFASLSDLSNLDYDFGIVRKYFYKIGCVTLLGVISTEVLSNFFSYLVTYQFGVSSFSIIALSMMLFRPVMVVSTSIAQSERSQLRAIISNKEAYQNLIKRISKLVFIAYSVNALCAFSFVYIANSLKFFGGFDYEKLFLYTFFFAFVFFARSVMAILSLDFQARGLFSLISKITIFMAVFSVFFLSVFSYFEDILIVLCVFSFVEILTAVVFFCARKRMLK